MIEFAAPFKMKLAADIDAEFPSSSIMAPFCWKNVPLASMAALKMLPSPGVKLAVEVRLTLDATVIDAVLKRHAATDDDRHAIVGCEPVAAGTVLQRVQLGLGELQCAGAGTETDRIGPRREYDDFVGGDRVGCSVQCGRRGLIAK